MKIQLIVLLAGTLLADRASIGAPAIVLGSKKFTESIVLTELAKRNLEEAGFNVEHQRGDWRLALRSKRRQSPRLAYGPDVQGFSAGDRVFGTADHTYAELCVVNAESLAKIPAGLDLVEAAALPLVTITGYQLITRGGANVKRGQSVLVTGALGNVGRAAVYTAKSQGAKVIAGVRKKQLEQAAALGADAVVAVDDRQAVESLPVLDAVADTVDGTTAELLISKVKTGGIGIFQNF